MASSTRKRKAREAWKKAKLAKNKSGVITVASKRRDKRQALVEQGNGNES